MLVNRESAISGARMRIGTKQSLNPPVIAGITIQKSLKEHELLLKHHKVDDSHQESDC